MIEVIFAIKFVHVLAAAVMLGAWLALALFMVLAHRSGNTSVVALTSQFVVRVELVVVATALALQPLSGVPLAYAIGLSPFNEFWIVLSVLLYAVTAAGWVAALRIEISIRNLAREAALNAVPLAADYRRRFGIWRVLAVPILGGMVAIFALMIWEPRLD